MIPYKLLKQRALDAAKRTAFIDGDREISQTFEELWDRAQRIAAGLHRLGIRKGSVVGTLLPNCIELVDVYLACGAVGAICQPMDTRFRGEELRKCLLNTSVKILFAWQLFLDPNVEAFVPANTLKVAVGDQKEGWMRYTDFLKGEKRVLPPIEQDEEKEDAVYLYTSGSTSSVKCVPMTWRQLDFFPQDLSYAFSNLNFDCGLSLLPMSHISGPIVINNVLVSGGSYVLTNHFSSHQIAKLVKRYNVTWTHTVPSIGQIILSAAQKIGGMESLRMVALMGSSVPPVLLEQLSEALPSAVIVQGYGLTETSPLITLQPQNRPKEKIISIGKKLPHVEIRIVDENGKEVADGQPGEIIVRGPKVFRGYVGNEELTRRVVRDGWFHTRDIGMRDAEGYYYHLGRQDDVIITGGLKVYPIEVENELLKHPGVESCVVYKEKDARRGEVIVAEIVPEGGATIDTVDLRNFLSTKLASYKIPRFFRTVEAIALTPTGKRIRKPKGKHNNKHNVSK